MALVVKNLPADAGEIRDVGSTPELGRCPGDGKMPWRWAWQLTPIFFPGESHGQRSLVGYIVHRVAKSQAQLSKHSCTHLQKFFEKALHSCKVFMV